MHGERFAVLCFRIAVAVSILLHSPPLPNLASDSGEFDQVRKLSIAPPF